MVTRTGYDDGAGALQTRIHGIGTLAEWKAPMTTVSLEEAQAHLPELLARVAAGQEFVITRDDTPLARLAPVPKTKPRPQFGSCKGMLTIVSDDDEHLEHFKEYMP